MRKRSDFRRHVEIESELLEQPVFAGGTLQFVKRLSARHSELLEYKFQSRSGVKSVFVKQQAPGANAEQATLKEFENLGRVRTLLGLYASESVPEPLLAVPKKGILAVSKVPGVPLAVILKKYANRLAGPFCTSAIGETTRRVGMWLRSFQDATHGGPFTYRADSYLADLELRLSQFHQKGFEPALAREILQQASLHSTALNGRIISAAASHGDFIPQNILIEDDEVAVVDFEGFSEGEAVYDDVGMFLGYLLVLSTYPPYSPRSLEAAHRGFLAGFLAGKTIDKPLLNIYMLKGVVRIIADGPPLIGHWSRLGTAWMLTKRLEELAFEGML